MDRYSEAAEIFKLHLEQAAAQKKPREMAIAHVGMALVHQVRQACPAFVFWCLQTRRNPCPDVVAANFKFVRVLQVHGEYGWALEMYRRNVEISSELGNVDRESSAIVQGNLPKCKDNETAIVELEPDELG